MQPEFLKKKWEAGTLGFHQEKIHLALERWGFPLLQGTQSSILILLLKSWEDHCLASRGHQVIAVEPFSRRELSSFEQSEMLMTQRGLLKNEPASGALTLLVILEYEAKLPLQDMIWDRAALVALAPPTGTVWSFTFVAPRRRPPPQRIPLSTRTKRDLP